MEKGQSPFYPGQPVPVELFVGRQHQLDRILKRGGGQVERGKPIAIFVQGEYGIGKSSIARYVQFLAAEEHGLLPINVSLSPAQTATDLASRIVEGAMHSDQLHRSRGDKIRSWLARYVGKQELFGFTVNLEALRSDAAKIASVHGLLDFLQQVLAALRSQDYRSILSKITGDTRFPKQDVEQELDDSERKKLNNFLQKMKSLNVLRSGDIKGEYIFNMSLVRLYLFMQRAELARKPAPSGRAP